MEKCDVRLRPMCRDDAEPVAAVHADLDVSAWNASQWAEAYQHSPDAWVVETTAIDDKKVVGYAIFRSICEQAELLNFGIQRQFQGKGIGRDLLVSTLTLLPDTVEEVLLEVRRSNVPAINLYHDLGFNEATVRRDYYPAAGGGREDALVMIKVL